MEDEKDNQMDEMRRLRGGSILMDSNKVIFSPTCCTDITDFDNWSEIKETTNFESILIGHPWILSKTNGKKILFTDYIEANGDAIDDSEIKYQANIDSFKHQTKRLIDTMGIFEERVKLFTANWYRRTQKVTKCLI